MSGPGAPAAPGAGYVVGVDGGGTRSRAAIADAAGREILRRTGAAGLVDPRDPASSAALLATLVRQTAEASGVMLPISGLCTGLAGAGDAEMREAVRVSLAASGVAERVEVVTDGVIALDGALSGEAGLLLVAGTGSVGYGRAEDGRVDRAGGWGMLVGDEGSGYHIARAGIQAALQALDGRGEPTRLVDLLEDLPLDDPREVPSWVARSGKADVAALAPRVIEQAEAGDGAAARIVDDAAADLARHAEALLARLGPWSGPVPVVFHGGLLGHPAYARRVELILASLAPALVRRAGAADAVTGAVYRALALREPSP